MATTITSVKTLVDSTDQSSDYVTTSWTPAAVVHFAAVVLTTSGGTPATPTLSGNGMTWTQITNGTFNGADWRLTTFWGYAASPSAGALTIQTGGTSHTGCLVSIVAATNLNVNNPVRSSNGASGTGTTYTAGTLSDFSGSANIGFVATTVNTTPGTDYTELDERTMATPAAHLEVEWWASPTDGVVDASGGSSVWRVAAINVNDAATSVSPILAHQYRQRRSV